MKRIVAVLFGLLAFGVLKTPAEHHLLEEQRASGFQLAQVNNNTRAHLMTVLAIMYRAVGCDSSGNAIRPNKPLTPASANTMALTMSVDSNCARKNHTMQDGALRSR